DTTAAPNLLALRADLKRLQGQIEDRDREIKGLKAEIAAFTDAHSTAPTAGSNEATRTRSITADRARLASLETLTGDQEKTIGRLRSDLTAANERLVRQAAHFMDELKRLGSAPAAAQQLASRPDQEPARKSRRSSSLTQRIRETIVQADATEGSGEVGTRERSQERSAVPAPTARAPELSLKDTPAPAASPAPSQTANGNGATPSPDARTTGNGKSNDGAAALTPAPASVPSPKLPAGPPAPPTQPTASAEAGDTGTSDQVSLKGLVARISNLERRS
ncbi:MAG: hypothetical protein AAFZ05_12070, partial [Pseudomonadota bacterium]